MKVSVLKVLHHILVGGEPITVVSVDGVTKIRLPSDEIISKTQIDEFSIECMECRKVFARKHLTEKLIQEDYLCMSCCKKGERNGFYGKTHTKELKDRLSKERLGVWYVGEMNPMHGKNVWEMVSDEQREVMREKNRQDTLNREYNPFKFPMREILGDERFESAIQKRKETMNNKSDEEKQLISARLSAAQKRVQLSDPIRYKEMKSKAGLASTKRENFTKNNLETRVENWLIEKGINHTYSAIMGNGKRNFQFDFIVHGRRILIECQGTYWHADPRKYDRSDLSNLTEAQVSNMANDLEKAKFALAKKFALIYIWENEVNQGNFSALERVLL